MERFLNITLKSSQIFSGIVLQHTERFLGLSSHSLHVVSCASSQLCWRYVTSPARYKSSPYNGPSFISVCHTVLLNKYLNRSDHLCSPCKQKHFSITKTYSTGLAFFWTRSFLLIAGEAPFFVSKRNASTVFTIYETN